ncbi:MAG: PAS domain-containing protein [Cephaloticoccus sp.]|nr:PAS domain-containing protein [Cephaloticoccus sp.]
MNTDNSSLPRIRTLAGLILVGSGVLLGGGMLVVWLFGDWRLTMFGPDYVPMAPSTAGLFVVLGLTALVLRGLRLGSWSHRVVLVTGVGATVLVAGSVLGAWIFGWSLPLVKWWAAAEAIRVGAIPVGRMSHLTAMVFLLVSAGLTLTSTRWRQTEPAVCAAGLALGTGFLVSLFVSVGYLTGSPILYGGEVVPMALLTGLGLMVLALGLLLSGPLCPALLQWRRERANASSVPAPDQFAQLLTAATAGIVLMISLFGFIYIRSQQTTTREQAYEQLDGIAALKAEQITQWRRERLGEANFLMRAPAVARDILAMIDSPNGAQDRQAVRGWLENIKAGDRYEAVMVFDEQLNLVFSIPEMTRGEIATPYGALRAALVSGTVQEVDLHPSKEFNDAHYNLLVPIRPLGGDAAAAAKALVSLRLNPAHYLFPKILSWPVANSTGESLIVRRDSDEVVFLSPLRRYAGPLFSLRYPIADLQLPAARAVRGEIGVFAGKDYDGVPVLSSSRRIPNSPWILVVKVDQAEVYGPMRKTAAMTGLFFGLLITSIVLAAGFLGRQRRLISMQRVLEAERSRNALASRIALLTRHANDIILLLDTRGKILEANERALLTYGYTLAELQGLPPGVLRAPESADDLETQFRKFASAEGGVIETQHRRKDGTTLFVQISGRAVPSADGDILLVIRDITERKAHEKEIERLVRLYDVLSQVNQAIVHAAEPSALVQEVCRILCVRGEFRLAWVGWINAETGLLEVMTQHGDATGFLKHLAGIYDNSDAAPGPIRQAIRENRSQVSPDIQHDPQTRPWHDAAREAGFNASMSIPLQLAGEIQGVLTVYSDVAGFFGAQEIALLEEAGSDISFALANLHRMELQGRAEQALAESEHRLDIATRSAGIGTWDWQVAGNRLIWDERMYALYGVGPDDFSGAYSEWIDRLHPDDREACLTLTRDALAGTKPYDTEFRVVWPDGQVRVIEAHATVFRDDGGTAVRMIGVNWDISERVRAEQTLKNLLQHSGALLKEVHHRVKNNLQVITSLLRLEAGKSKHAATKEVLAEMQGRIRSMALLHETLYRTGDFALIDLENYLQQLATQLVRALNTAPDRVQLALTLAPIKLEIDQAIPCGLIVNELLTNALKHAFPAGRVGQVRLTVQPVAPGQMSIQVSDDGVGLPPDFDLARINSLGLQLVSDLARQLRGKLAVGPGSTFTILFTPQKLDSRSHDSAPFSI